MKAEFMLAFLPDHNDSQSVIDVFKRLYLELRPDRFCSLFKVCLADNGTEFSNPRAIEYDRQGNLPLVFFIAIQALPTIKAPQNATMNLYAVFFRKELTLLPIRRKISVL